MEDALMEKCSLVEVSQGDATHGQHANILIVIVEMCDKVSYLYQSFISALYEK
jgi:hypothetical protein